MTTTNAVELLKTELSRRMAKNPRYSMRRFAKTLGLSPTTLSAILSKQRKLSKKATIKISKNLGVLIPFESALETPVQLVQQDMYEILSDWYHMAILSLLEMKDSKFDSEWISKRLGISELEARFAIERLMRAGIVAKIHGRYRQTTAPLRIDERESTAASRKLQSAFLKKAVEALENHKAAIRDITSMIFCLNPRDIPEAVNDLAQFRHEFSKKYENRPGSKKVYSLSVQLFSLESEE